MSTTYRSLLLVVAVATAGCLEIDPPNKPPTASVQVMLGGAALAPMAMTGILAPAYPIMGAGQSVTLAGAGMDPDGTVASYQWWRTDVTRAMRSPPMMMAAGGTGAAGMAAAGAGGMGAAGMAAAAGAGGAPMIPPPPFTGDPPPMPTITVDLPVVGNYRFSLWVTDNEGLASAPASVTLVVR